MRRGKRGDGGDTVKFTDAELLRFRDPRCKTDRDVRHAEYRQRVADAKRRLAIVPVSALINVALRLLHPDAVEGEEIRS